MRVEMLSTTQQGPRSARFSATTAANGYAGLSLLSAQLPSNYLPQSVLPNEFSSQALTPSTVTPVWPFPGQPSGMPSTLGPSMLPYGQPSPMVTTSAFGPYLPPGYVPILAPVSLLQQLSDPSLDNFERHADLEVPVSSSLRHERGDSADFSTSGTVADEKSEPESPSVETEKKDTEDRASTKHHTRPEPLLRRVRRWAGAAFVVAGTTTSALAGASFGWRRQQFLVPSVLKRLPMFAQRSISTMNAGVLAGGIGFLITDTLRNAVGLNPRRLHYHTVDTDIDTVY